MFQNDGKYDNLVNDIANIINKKEDLPQELQDAATAASKEIVGKGLEDRRHIMTKHLLDTGISITSKMSKEFENLVEAKIRKGPIKPPTKIVKAWAVQVSEVADKKITPKQVALAANKLIQDGQLEFLRPNGIWSELLDPEEAVAMIERIKGAKVVNSGVGHSGLNYGVPDKSRKFKPGKFKRPNIKHQ